MIHKTIHVAAAIEKVLRFTFVAIMQGEKPEMGI